MAARPAREPISSFRCARFFRQPCSPRSRCTGSCGKTAPMKQFTAPASMPAPHIKTDDAFARLTFLGWGRGLAAIIAALTASFFLFGYALIYWRNADMDFVVIHNALALNDGRPLLYFEHPAYITILSVRLWFRLLHAIGLLDAWSLSAFPSDEPGFGSAMTSAVRAGRLLAFFIATGCVLAFAGLARLIVRDWRVAMFATLAFAFSGGVAVHARILRSELLSACPIIFALMILIALGRSARVARPLGLALAAGLCVLGLENKVQAILLIGLLPMLILPFGSAASQSTAFWRDTQSGWLVAGLAAASALLAAWTAWPLIQTALDGGLPDAARLQPLFLDRFGIYQAALLALIAGCMVAFSVMWRISAAETVASIFAIAAGASIALLALNIEYSAGNVITVLNPLERMLTFADPTTSNAANQAGLGEMLMLLLHGIGSVLARYSFVLHTSPRPTVFLVWLIVPGIFYAWRRGENLAAIQALVLLIAAVGVDAVAVTRGLKSEYFIFTDPLIIIAGAILLDRLSELRFFKWTYPVAILLVGLHIVVGQAEPIKYAFMRRGPESICQWSGYYLPLLPPPWCRISPARP